MTFSALARRRAPDTNASLVMSTVRGDGVNLQPDRPATTLDAALLGVFSDGVPDVRSTWSAYLRHTYRWHHVLATQLVQNVTITLADLGPVGAAPAFAVVDWFSRGIVAELTAPDDAFVVPSGQGQPSAPKAALPIQHFTVMPQLPGGWWLYGEADKVVPMSKQRVSDVALLADGFSASVAGSSGEAAIVMLVAKPNSTQLEPITCPSGKAGVFYSLTCFGSSANATCSCK